MVTDRAGNTRNRARNINLSGSAIFKDQIGGRDRNDFLRFTLDSRSSTNFALAQLKSDVNLQLLNSSGQALVTSAQKGRRSESIKTTLETGTYYLRIYPGSNNKSITNYRLSAFATPLPVSTPTPTLTPIPTPTPSIPTDYAGNALSTAHAISVNSAINSYSDWIGDADTSDFYQFTTDEGGALSLTLSGLTADANVRLIQDVNNNGTVEESEILASSFNTGTTSKSLTHSITADTYFLQVLHGSGDTNYTLTLSLILPIAPNEPSQNTLPTGANAIPINNLSGDSQIDGLLSKSKWGFSWGNQVLTYSFYEDSVFGGAYYGIESGVREVSENVKNRVRSIFSDLSNLINIDFQEVTETSTNYGRLRFMLSNMSNSPDDYAYAYSPFTDTLASYAGDIHLNPKYDVAGDTWNGFQNPPGTHGYMSLIHEIGHALGLKHPYDKTPNLPISESNTTNTVMTYNFTGSPAGTFMPFDIKALQYLYGERSYSTTNTVYQFTDRIDQFVRDGQTVLNTPNSIKQTIWDSSGIDTLDFSKLPTISTGYRFDMNPGGMLTTQAAFNATRYKDYFDKLSTDKPYSTTTYGTAIAYNVSIENLINSGSNDTIFANNTDNTFGGYNPQRYTGNDIIWNASSQDTLDLSLYSPSAISQNRSNNDLIIGLGGNGSITVKNYYAGSSLKILLASPPALPTITIATTDANAAETTSGQTTNLGQFTLNRTGSLTSTLTVNYILSGIAINGTDYSNLAGTATFAIGAATTTIAINPIDDNVSEGDELVSITLAPAASYTIGSQKSAMITIVDNDSVAAFSDSGVALPGASGKSVRWGDYDRDGDLDILLTGRTGGLSSTGVAKVLRNDAGTFTDINAGLPTGSTTWGDSAWGDYDNDGDLDILLIGTYASFIYRNDNGNFANTQVSLLGSWGGTGEWGDYDNDGDLDVLLTGDSTGSGSQFTKIYRNDAGNFVDINASLIGVSFGSAKWGDFDSDRDLDILITGYTSSNTYISRVYRNDGGLFTNINANLTPIYGEAAWGDFDNDGDLDILLSGRTSTSVPYNAQTFVYRNTSGTFAAVGTPMLSNDGTGGWGDYDNDGDLDALLTSGLSSGGYAYIWRSSTSGLESYGGTSLADLSSTQSADWGDYDNDGDLDIVAIGSITGSDVGTSRLFKNNSTILNTAPTVPVGSGSFVNGSTVTLSWLKATDAQTPQNGLTYNLRIGTTPGGSNILSPMSTSSGQRQVVEDGNAGHNTSWIVKNLAPGTYYWSVQAIDTSFKGSAFSTESVFTIA
ncbi:MAG TPA: FG-GAP-like repeat-containing protein [Crinalium sp.]|jgi:predicted nucleotidyltransferase